MWLDIALAFEKTTDDGPPFVVKWFEKSGALYFRLLPKIASNAVAILEGIGSPFSQPLSHLLPTVSTEQVSMVCTQQPTFVCFACSCRKDTLPTQFNQESPSVLVMLFHAGCKQGQACLAFSSEQTQTALCIRGGKGNLMEKAASCVAWVAGRYCASEIVSDWSFDIF